MGSAKIFMCFALVLACAVPALGEEPPREKIRILVASSLDGVEEPVDFYPAPVSTTRPLLVLLHTWSNDVDSHDPSDWLAALQHYNWHVLVPNYRGANMRPEACASKASRQDILDAVAHIRAKYKVDGRRIYLAGVSGGGHMTLVMAAEAPELWAAASSWVPISDLALWHGESKAADRKYWKDVELVAGGAPGANAKVDGELHYRSPRYHLGAAAGLPVDINAGIDDGHTGSVPVHHALLAFNALAEAQQAAPIPEATIMALDNREYHGETPPTDPAYARALVFRAEAGPSRVTLFEGGHEGLPESACAWLSRHRKINEAE